jgi:formimidoylglutamate deiminase
MVFSSPGLPWRDVMVAGRWVVRDGRHPRQDEALDAYREAMARIA